MRALIYHNGQLLQTVVGMRSETAQELRNRVQETLVIAIDRDKTPACPECQDNNHVALGMDAWICKQCNTSFIPDAM